MSTPAVVAPSAAAPPYTFAAADAPRWFGVLMIAIFALMMPVGYLGDEGEAPLVAIGGIGALAFVLQKRPPSIGVILLGLLTLWAVVSFAWSPLEPRQIHVHAYKQLEALTAPKLVLQLVFLSAFVSGAQKLAGDQRDRALSWLALTLAVTTGALVADALVDGEMFGAISALSGKPLRPDLAQRDAARGCYAVALLFWPAALATWRRVPPAVPILVAAATAGSALRLGVDAPAVALLLSLLVFLGVRVNARAGVLACLAGVVVYFLAAPLLFLSRSPLQPQLPSDVGKLSWHIRLDIWRFASGLIAQRPWLGYGLDSSRAFEPRIPMHPHDAALQLWLELGAAGPVLAALFFGWMFWKVLRVTQVDAVWTAVACATATVYLLIGAISFGVWQEWWLALGAAAIAACLMVLRARRDAAVGDTPGDAADGGLTAL